VATRCSPRRPAGGEGLPKGTCRTSPTRTWIACAHTDYRPTIRASAICLLKASVAAFEPPAKTSAEKRQLRQSANDTIADWDRRDHHQWRERLLEGWPDTETER